MAELAGIIMMGFARRRRRRRGGLAGAVIPDGALVDRDGNTIVDRSGNYIVEIR